MNDPLSDIACMVLVLVIFLILIPPMLAFELLMAPAPSPYPGLRG